MGTGTGKSSRFGDRTEIIYSNTDVKYSWGWAYHEGIDRHSVNNDYDTAVADRLELQAKAKTDQFNAHHGKFISDSAGETVTAATLTEDEIVKAFNELAKYFVNIGATGTKVAKVTPDVWNIIVDSKLMTTSKGSSVELNDGAEMVYRSTKSKKGGNGKITKQAKCWLSEDSASCTQKGGETIRTWIL